MSVKASLVRDLEGFPVLAVVTQGAQKIEVVYEKDSGFTLSGSRRSLENQALINALRLIYPTQDKIDFAIPQPLQTVNVQGGKIVLFDDMESLFKWSAGAADNTNAFNGGQSLKLTIAGGATTGTLRRFAMPPSGKIRGELYFSCDDWTTLAGVDSLTITLFNDDGVSARQVQFQFDRTGPRWYIYNSDVYTFNQPAAFSVLAGVYGTWHKVTFEADFKKNLFHFIEIDSFRLEFTNKTLLTAATTGTVISSLTLTGHAGAGGANLWFDDVLITEA